MPYYVKIMSQHIKSNLRLLNISLFASLFEKTREKTNGKIFKQLGPYEILLETNFKHWIPVLGTPEVCPALGQFYIYFIFFSL